jgi:catechol 2,3-dioxygenase-like lactoylglutathione lyase family enzyme
MIAHEGIHHVSLNVRDLERAKAFYRDVIGLQEMERPAFQFPGAWFSVGNNGQQLHLIVYPGQAMRDGGIDSRDGHFAIRIKSWRQTLEWLDRWGVSYDARPNSMAGFPQIYVIDPDHNVIELNADAVD